MKKKREKGVSSSLDKWTRMATEKSLVDSSLYAKYDVKRGLRDISGKEIGRAHV